MAVEEMGKRIHEEMKEARLRRNVVLAVFFKLQLNIGDFNWISTLENGMVDVLHLNKLLRRRQSDELLTNGVMRSIHVPCRQQNFGKQNVNH